MKPSQDIGQKRLIFTMSPGRCGTRYLAEMLGTVPSITALHEPKPEFADAARLVQFVPDAAKVFWQRVKLPTIARYKEPVYFETSHPFTNGFPPALLELGIVPDLVVLTRPHRETALSRWRRGSIPGRTDRGNQYAIHPEALGNLLPLKDWKRLTDYQLCYWFCLEVEARSRFYGDMFKQEGATVHKTSLGQIATEAGFLRLLDALDLPYPDFGKYRAIMGQRSNATPDFIRGKLPEGNLEKMETEVVEAAKQERQVKQGRKPSVHIFLINTGSIREELSAWREKWQADKRFNIIIEGGRGFPVTDNRGRCVLKFLAGKGDYMVMVDEDVVPQRNILDLAEQDLDIVVFPTPIWRPKKSPRLPVMLNVTPLDESGNMIEGTLEMGEFKDLHPISSGGTGCIMIARCVLEHPAMFHAFKDLWRFDGTRSIGNDIWFVQKARAAGFKAYAAMRYPCSHFKTIDLLRMSMVYDELIKRGNNNALE